MTDTDIVQIMLFSKAAQNSQIMELSWNIILEVYASISSKIHTIPEALVKYKL